MKDRFLILTARFNEFITKQLYEGAVATLTEQGVDERSIVSLWVPGCFELPSLASRAAQSKKFSAIICLGTVIRGETPHFDFVAAQTAAGIMRAGYESGVPAIFGVLTTNTAEQALARTGIKFVNKGRESALAAIEMVSVCRKLDGLSHP